MTKLVNLDELAAAKRQIKFKGNTHEVLDLPLVDFIEFQKDFQGLLESQIGGDIGAMLDTAKKIIGKCVPTFSQAAELNMRQLMATVQLIADFYPSADEAGNEQSHDQSEPEA